MPSRPPGPGRLFGLARRPRPAAAACLIVSALAGCTDSFTVTAPYQEAWQRATETMVANGFQMVTVSDERRLVPASNERTGRAWFLAKALPDPAGWEAPRVVQVSIEPVDPPGAAQRRITVEAEQRDWVVQGNVPDPELRSRVVWMLKQAFSVPGAVPPEDPPRHAW